MRMFLFILAFILILFGASILYYRSSPDGGFTLPKISLPLFDGSSKNNGEQEGAVLSENTEKYQSLEIVESSAGGITVGQKKSFFAVAKTENGGSISVNGNWYLSDTAVASLDSDRGSEITLKADREGKTTVFLSFQDLKAEKEILIGGEVLGSAVTNSPTATPRPSSEGTSQVPAQATPSPTPAPRAVAVNIYDPDGRRIVVGDQRNFTARVVFSDGSERSLNVDWSIGGGVGTISRTHSTNTDFKALKMGSGTITASYQGISSTLSIQVN